MPESVIRKLPLYRRRTLVYTVLFLGLVTGIGICTFGDSLMVIKQSVDTQRLIHYGGRSMTRESSVPTGVGRGGITSSTLYLKVGNVTSVLVPMAFNGSDTEVHFNGTHRSDTPFSGLSVASIPPFKTQTGGKNLHLGVTQLVRGLFHNTTNAKTSSSNLSSDVIGDRVKFLGSVPGREYPLFKNKDQMGIVATLNGDNRIVPTSATRLASVNKKTFNNSHSVATRSFSLPLKEVNPQTIGVDKNGEESRNFTSMKYYQTNLTDTSFYDNQIKVNQHVQFRPLITNHPADHHYV